MPSHCRIYSLCGLKYSKAKNNTMILQISNLVLSLHTQISRNRCKAKAIVFCSRAMIPLPGCFFWPPGAISCFRVKILHSHVAICPFCGWTIFFLSQFFLHLFRLHNVYDQQWGHVTNAFHIFPGILKGQQGMASIIIFFFGEGATPSRAQRCEYFQKRNDNKLKLCIDSLSYCDEDDAASIPT